MLTTIQIQEYLEFYRGRRVMITGGVGTALFAADCLDGRAVFPVVDSFDW